MKKVLTKELDGRRFIVAHIERREPGGLLSPGFATSGALYEPHGTWSGQARYRNHRSADSYGQIGDDLIVTAFPQIAPVVRLHLSDLDGAPIHAESNGWHYYSGAARRHEEERRYAYPADRWPYSLSDRQRAARALRVDVDELPYDMSREQFAAYVESLRPRWQREADDATAIIKAL